MRRRLTLAIVGVVTGALLFAGLGTLLLVRRATREDARRDLVEQATTMAQSAEEAQRKAVVDVIRRVLRLDGFAVVRYGPAGRRLDPLPDGLTDADVALDRLRRGDTLSGNRNGIVFAAAPIIRGDNRSFGVVVLTRDEPGLGVGIGWFVTAASLALLMAVVVGDRLARRITRPLRDAEEATRRIATGDLTSQVAVGDGRYPELDALGRSINAMAADLERAKGLERRFLLSVSHDLRTPLTSIRGYAEAIADGTAKRNDIRRAAEVIGAESRRLERLVQDLLDLARLDTREFSLDMRAVDATTVMGDTVEGFRPMADDAGVALTVEAAQGVAVHADRDRLAQVVANLVENALKYAATTITVSIDGEGILSVVDDGPGIPPEELPRVFERLYQSSRPPVRRDVGSGLGLAIVAELVGAMGATIEMQSPASGGTRVVVRLSRSPHRLPRHRHRLPHRASSSSS